MEKAQRAPRVQLDTLPRVRREAARLYMAARRGEITAADASRLASVLGLVGRLIEGGEIERRIEIMEAGRLDHKG